MVRKYACLISGIFMAFAWWHVASSLCAAVGHESDDTRKISLNRPESQLAADSAWISMLNANAERLEENLVQCLESCNRTIKAADAAGESAVMAVALLQRSCAHMDLYGIEHSHSDFKASLDMFPDSASHELRLRFTQALCFRERYSAPRGAQAISTAFLLELARLPNGVNPSLRLRAFCDVLSSPGLDASTRRDVLESARKLANEIKRPELNERLEFLAVKCDQQADRSEGSTQLMTMADSIFRQSSPVKLPRSLKIEILIAGAREHGLQGDLQKACAYLKAAQSEARILRNNTLVAQCDGELVGMARTGAEAQTAFREWQSVAGESIAAINDDDVLKQWLQCTLDKRSSSQFKSETTTKLSERLNTLKTFSRLSADELNLRNFSRAKFIEARQAEQITAEQLRADGESRWSLLVARIALGVFFCLALILLREKWQLSRANTRLRLEMIKNEQQQLEKERIELRLARTERLDSIGALAGGIAHDFNNLLVGVIGNADLLTHIEPDSPMAQQCVAGIIRSAETAADLSRKMLAYAGKEVARKKIIDLNELVHRMMPLLRSGLGGRHSVKFFPVPACVATEADSGQIEQILLNLVSNASQAIEGNNGLITVRTGIVTLDEIPVDIPVFGNRKEGGTFAWIEVSDTGSGIPESDLSRIFEPFYSTRQQSSGHGFGLAVVYGHVNRHDGLIQVESCVNHGTRLRILLPYSGEPVSTDAAPLTDTTPSTVSEFFSVVAVDDQLEVLDVIKRTLAASGATAHTFLTVTEAMEFLADNDQIDCILLDMMMPVVDGNAMLEELMQIGIQIPVVVMSGNSATDPGDFPGFPGVRAVMQKPFRPGDLLATVRSVIAAASKSGGLATRELQDSSPRQ